MAGSKASKKRKRAVIREGEGDEPQVPALKSDKQAKRQKTRKARLPAKEIFPFLHLPGEIRNMIYRYCLIPRARRLQDLYGESQPTSALTFAPYQTSANVSISLLRLNKRVHAEASDIFYNENTISVRLCDKDEKNLKWKEDEVDPNRRLHRSGRLSKAPNHDISHGSLYEHVFLKFRHYSFTLWWCCGWEHRLAELENQIDHGENFSLTLMRKATRKVEDGNTGHGRSSGDSGIKTLEIDMRMHCWHAERKFAFAEVIAPALEAFSDLRQVETVNVRVRRMSQRMFSEFEVPGLDACVDKLKSMVQKELNCKDVSKPGPKDEPLNERPGTPWSCVSCGTA